MTQEPALKVKKKQKAYEFIRSHILDGTYEPGFRVVADRVARELSLSVIPVREAIQQLESEGFIQVIPYSGAVVQLVNDDEYQETMYVLAILEGSATALAAKQMTMQEIGELEALNEKMKEALYNFEFDQFAEFNREFHSLICNKCGNAYLIDRITQAWQRIRQCVRPGFAFAPQRLRESVKEHEELVKLFKESVEVAEIEKYVRQHTFNTANAVKQRNAANKIGR